jgi:hypothetical protein
MQNQPVAANHRLFIETHYQARCLQIEAQANLIKTNLQSSAQLLKRSLLRRNPENHYHPIHNRRLYPAALRPEGNVETPVGRLESTAQHRLTKGNLNSNQEKQEIAIKISHKMKILRLLSKTFYTQGGRLDGILYVNYGI